MEVKIQQFKSYGELATMGKFCAERVKQNLRKGRNVQYNGKRLSQCINSSDSSFSSFLSAPKKKEVRWEASSLEVGSARYSKTTSYHASLLIYFLSLFQEIQKTGVTKPYSCSAGHSLVQSHPGRPTYPVLYYAELSMHSTRL